MTKKEKEKKNNEDYLKKLNRERIGKYLDAGFTEKQAEILYDLQEQIYQKINDDSDY